MTQEIYFIKGKRAYYDEATRILETSTIFKVLAKTPTLFISSQRIEPHQKAYYDKLMNAIKDNQIFIEYMFSLPLTNEEILNIAKINQEQALQDLNDWESFSQNPKIDLRYIETKNPFSCVIGNKYAAVLMVYPNGDRGCMVVLNEKLSFYIESFAQIFQNASKDNKTAIKQIKNNILSP